jgi:hypothetical protein
MKFSAIKRANSWRISSYLLFFALINEVYPKKILIRAKKQHSDDVLVPNTKSPLSDLT